MYFRSSINCQRKNEIEISKLETLWTEISFTNSKPFLLCSLYRPPNASSDWIDLFEVELSIAQTTGLEIVIMGDFNIEHSNCLNKKWLHFVELFDLKQMVSSPTRVTNSSSSIIDHIYCTDSEKISECFVPHYSISDHFPICLTRKINQKLKKSNHITTSYRCFKHFNEKLFLNDLTDKLSHFSLSESDIEDDLSTWYKLITKQLDQHAPIKTRRVKSKRMPECFFSGIAQARKNRDIHKKQKNWAEFRK